MRRFQAFWCTLNARPPKLFIIAWPLPISPASPLPPTAPRHTHLASSQEPSSPPPTPTPSPIPSSTFSQLPIMYHVVLSVRTQEQELHCVHTLSQHLLVPSMIEQLTPPAHAPPRTTAETLNHSLRQTCNIFSLLSTGCVMHVWLLTLLGIS